MKRNHWNRRWLGIAAIVALIGVSAACSGGSASHKATGGSSANSVAANGSTQQQLGTIAKAETAPQDAAAQSAAVAGAPAGANSGASSGGEAPALPSQLDRKMIVVATVNLALDDVSRGFEDVGNIAAVEGGFISSSAFGHNGDKQTASVTIRVPADKYQDAVNRIRRLGDVRDEQANSSDVTEEYTDLQSRLRNLQATEQTYLQFLSRAADITQVLTVQDRINSTRAEIEQVQGRINLVQNQTDLATITVHLDPTPATAEPPKAKASGAPNPLEVARDSFDASLLVLRGIATAGLATVAFGWWLLPLIAVAWYFARRQTARVR